MNRYDRLIDEAKRRLDLPGAKPPLDLGSEEVQMSVRIPSDLRDAVSDVARRQGKTLTAMVTELLVKAVDLDRDPFVALASDLAGHTRAALADAVAVGDYGRAAAEIDAGDGAEATR